jgi:uncharacterized protein YodC (DUF2158 family)
MRRRVMMVLASAALAGSLLATDAQAHGGGEHGGGGGTGHMGSLSRAYIGSREVGFSGARVGGIAGGYITGIPRGAVGYATGTGYGMGTGYGTSILRGRYSILAASSLAQSAAPSSSSGASVPAPALGAVRNPPIGGRSSRTGSGSGFTLVGRESVSTKTVGMAPTPPVSAPSNTQNQTVPAFGSGNLVRLRSGGPLMTVKSIKADEVDCFWTDFNGQINANSFPVGVLQLE